MKQIAVISPERAAVVDQIGAHAWTLAGTGLGKMIEHGQRGLSLISEEELAALVSIAAIAGVPALKKGKAPDTSLLTRQIRDARARLAVDFVPTPANSNTEQEGQTDGSQ